MSKRLGFDLILLGDPASGKDTQAKLLERVYAFKLVESGKYLRGLQRRKTKTANSLRANLTKGLPAPSGIIKEFLEANVRLAPKDKDLLFVGNPRLVAEADYLARLFKENNRKFFVLYITLPVREIWVRSEKRMRNIDDTKHVRTRISWHKKQVSKTIKFFQKSKKFRFIDGDSSIKSVNKEILSTLRACKD